MFVLGRNRFQPYYHLDDQRLLADESRVMNQSDSQDWIPTDPVARRKATGGVRHTTGGRFNEGYGDWSYGQPPHGFNVIKDRAKGLQPGGEPYWRWVCACRKRMGGYRSKETARGKAYAHMNAELRKERKPVGHEAAARDKPPPEAFDRIHDQRKKRARRQKDS